MLWNVLIIVLIVLLSSWTRAIISNNFIIGFICIILSFFLLSYLRGYKTLSSLKLDEIFITCFWLIIIGYLLFTSFDRNLFTISEDQYIKILQRQEIYSQEFNQLYRNKYGIYYFNQIKPRFLRYCNNISNMFDLENLFVLSYSDNKTQTRFPLIFTPFLLIGLFNILKLFDSKFIIPVLILLFITGFLNTNNSLGLIFIYPLICATIGLGISKILKIKNG